MDEVSSHVRLDLPLGLTARPSKRLFHLVLESHDGRALGADSEEKHEPVSDIDTVAADSLKALDPKRPIREADILGRHNICRDGQKATCGSITPLGPPCAGRRSIYRRPSSF